MEPHGQSPWFHRDAHKGRTSRIRGPIHLRVERVVLLVPDRRVRMNRGMDMHGWERFEQVKYW